MDKGGSLNKPRFRIGRGGRIVVVSLVLCAIVIIACLAALIFLILPGLFYSSPSPYPWTFQQALAVIDAPIPLDVVDVDDHSSVGSYYAINVTFKASPSTVHRFAAGICHGELYQRYDPFETRNVSVVRYPYAILVPDEAIHFAFSNNTPDTVFGNHCRQTRSTLLQISIDKSDPALYSVRLSSEDLTLDLFPSVPLADYELPLEGTDFPLIVVGLRHVETDYALVGNRLCMEPRSSNVWRSDATTRLVNPETTPYIGSDVRVRINGVEMPPATINDDGKFVAYDQVDNYRNWEWNYCLTMPTTPGRYQVDMIVTTSDGVVSGYTWDYVVE